MQVFLSYAWTEHDKRLARMLAGALRAASMTPWFDEERMRPGVDIEQSIRLAIENSDSGVFLVSRTWTERDFTRQELYQFSLRKPRPPLIALLREPREHIARLIPAALSQVTHLEWLDDGGQPEERFWQLYCGLLQIDDLGPRSEWAARGAKVCGTAFSATAAPALPAGMSPSAKTGPYGSVSITCDRTRHWGAIVTHARVQQHEVLALRGPRGFGHKQLLMRIAQELTDPPRVVKEVSWSDRRPETLPDLLELLLHALSDHPPSAGDLEARVGECLRSLLSARNLVLLHPALRGGFDRAVLLEYYTSTLPRILAAAPLPHHVKCVQPLEWLPRTAVGRLARGLTSLFGAAGDDEREDADESSARRFIDRLKRQAAPYLPVAVLPPLDAVPDDEIDEFLARQNLTEAQRTRLLRRVRAVAKTPDEIFRAIDDYYPEVRGSAS